MIILMNNDENLYFQTYENLYSEIDSKDALLLLALRNWFIAICNFDPRTGQPMPMSLGELLQKIRSVKDTDEKNDRFSRIIEHSNDALHAILKKPRDKILREHAMMPIYAAREFDSTSVQWLSRKTGRNLREKLAGKPYIKAVKRRESLDTAENRLFKAFMLRVEQLIFVRHTLDHAPDGELLQSIQRWIKNDEVREIGRWANLSPNNALLKDKNYRKIWDAWGWLRNIDEKTKADHKRLKQDFFTALFWSIVSSLDELKSIRFLQQPCYFDYDLFCINSFINLQGRYYPLPDNNRVVGRVKDIHPNKDLVFSINEKKETVFCYASDFESNEIFKSLKIGTLISYFESKTKNGFKAKKIKVVVNNEVDVYNVILSFNSENKKINIQVGSKSIQIECEKNSIKLAFSDNLSIYRFTDDFPSIKTITNKTLSLLLETATQTQNVINTESTLEYSEVVIDLCSTRPKFTPDGESDKRLPFRLVRQYWSDKDRGDVAIDCGTAKAIILSDNITTITMFSLFAEYEDKDKQKSLLPNAAMEFIKEIKGYISAKTITYLVPDYLSEFSLENIRRSLNFYFPNSAPLPRSIAAVFSWQSSENFVQSNFTAGDVVLVIENGINGIFITPLISNRSKELSAYIPESKGVFWERHPSSLIEGIKSVDVTQAALEQSNCSLSKEIAHLFDFNSLLDEKDSLSWVNTEQEWFNLPKKFEHQLVKQASNNSINLNDLKKVIESIPKSIKIENIYLLPINNSFNKPNEENSFKWLGSSWSLTKGGQVLSQWQKKAIDIALWKDHLPELSIKIPINGCWDDFYLVKNTTIIPKKGKSVQIPIKDTFTLPENLPHYSFPLRQGSGGHALQYQANLKSPAFPLSQATVCRLLMSYTYGADNPYQLQFVPVNPMEAGFQSVQVEWMEVISSNEYEVTYPKFPPRNTWDKFSKYPNKLGNVSNLIEWIERDLKQIESIKKYGRCSSKIKSDWVDKGENNVFCFSDDDVFLHKKSFIESTEKNIKSIIKKGDTVYFYKTEKDGKFRGFEISISEEVPRECFLKSLRFPSITVWNQAHSLSETDVSAQFRQSVFEGVKNALQLRKNPNVPENLKQELFFFLCCIHKDTDIEITKILLNYTKNKSDIRKYSQNIAFAIGDVTLDWQKMILDNITNDEYLTEPATMEILAIACWRFNGLIDKFTHQQLIRLTNKLYRLLSSDIKNIKSDAKYNQLSKITKYLELLLALLRTRANEDEKIKSILSPNQEITRKFVVLIEDLTQKIIKLNLNINSRITLELDKPKAFNKTPDLLYALRMYLTGDSGANSIQVTEIKDSD
ncbi:MAG: DUF2357 domain-containing protein [Methylococcaceae bacterium]|nr:MAG: DUF2357 domain-containing protein [Methylococcaceae bacterium]